MTQKEKQVEFAPDEAYDRDVIANQQGSLPQSVIDALRSYKKVIVEPKPTVIGLDRIRLLCYNAPQILR